MMKKKALRFLSTCLRLLRLLDFYNWWAPVEGVGEWNLELGRVRKVLSGSNSTAVPRFKCSVSLFPAQAAPADFVPTREKRTDSTQLLWSLTDSC